ncbi:hypothetical protein DMUE_4830 [Dictyocoela muelleri]|nr:hypothetical protein DMUE_4830 [Dictyocoela muelleri]
MYTSIDQNPFINKTLFTSKNTPLPLSDSEKLLYFSKGVQFFIQFGGGVLGLLNKFCSSNGTLFLTNKRLIYKPDDSNFVSFSVSLNYIVDIYKEETIDILVGDGTSVPLYLTFYESQKLVFFNLLRRLKDESFVGESEDVPYYCEIIKK